MTYTLLLKMCYYSQDKKNINFQILASNFVVIKSNLKGYLRVFWWLSGLKIQRCYFCGLGAVVWVQSLALDFPHTTGPAKNENNNKNKIK